MALMTKIKWAVSFTAIVLALVSGTTLVVPPGKILAHDGAPKMQHDGLPSDTVSELKVEIVIQEGGQPRLKGQKTHGQVIEVVAGQSVALVFRNEDAVPREFVSPLFSRTEIHFEGRATGMFRKDAAGFGLNPASTLRLEFVMRQNGLAQMYDLLCVSHDEDMEHE